MPRFVTITLPADQRRRLVDELQTADGIVSMSLQRDASLRPPGDVLTVSTTNEGLLDLLGLLSRHELDEQVTVQTSAPYSLVSAQSRKQLDDESNEASWPEMAALLRSDTNITSNYLLAMAFAGFVAGVGLLTDTLHIIIGAMVLAPGFEPLIRVPFGLLGGERRAWQQGLSSTLAGYAALVLGAALSLPLTQLATPQPIAVGQQQWVQYWSDVPMTSLLVALAAGATGATIVAGRRSVLTTGVMITLALIPSMAIVGLGLATFDTGLAALGGLRWLVDALCVVVAGGLVFLIKRQVLRRRGDAARISAPL